MDIPQISAEQAQDQHKKGEAIILDVRTKVEREQWYIPNSFFLPLDEITEESVFSLELPFDQAIILQCRSGGRSQTAAEELARMGYTKVSNLIGGIKNWHQSGYEIIGTPEA